MESKNPALGRNTSAVYLGLPLSEYVSQSLGLTFLAWTAYSKDSHEMKYTTVYVILYVDVS